MKARKRFAATVKVGEKGQFVVPKEIREMFDIQPGDTLLLLADTKRGIAVVKDGEVLQVQGLTKRYPAFALEEVSFDLRPGAITGFIGRNGAGKSTTFKSLLNLVHPDAGEVRFFGLEFTGHEGEIKSRIGYVPGEFVYYPRKKLGAIVDVTRHLSQLGRGSLPPLPGAFLPGGGEDRLPALSGHEGEVCPDPGPVPPGGAPAAG